MEHRWGERVAVRMTVELSSGSSPPVAGNLENVSSSGAFVRTEGRGPPRGPVAVMLRQEGPGRPHSARLAAYVVREAEDGVGIEWCEFAPLAVRELMIRGRAAGDERAPARRLRAARRTSHEPNTAMPPHAQPATDPSAIGTRS
jgi:PilZ domain